MKTQKSKRSLHQPLLDYGSSPDRKESPRSDRTSSHPANLLNGPGQSRQAHTEVSFALIVSVYTLSHLAHVRMHAGAVLSHAEAGRTSFPGGRGGRQVLGLLTGPETNENKRSGNDQEEMWGVEEGRMSGGDPRVRCTQAHIKVRGLF